jgi:hypothetical protein
MVEPVPRPVSVEGERFTFLNLQAPFAGWNDTARGMLWAYNLNYFDFLNQPGMTEEEGGRWIDRFIQSLPANRVGLDPYPIALRGINWVKFFARYPEAATRQRLDALHAQYRLLLRKPERHLLGNHLLEDYFSLFAVSLYLGDTARHAGIARRLLRELDEELLADGGHFEQSVMYHCILLDRLLDCLNIAQALSPCPSLRPYAERMLGYLQAICYADGSYPLFNDAALGIAPTPAELFDYARRLGLTWQSARLGASGYRKLTAPGMEALVDIGGIAATYQPGHSHADTFTYELRLDGAPLVVDTGISTYNKTERRQYERSTRAHNTVTVAGKDSSEVWGGFRIGARARLSEVKSSSDEVSGKVTGFGGNLFHHRTFRITPEACFEVEDKITEGQEGVSYVHLSPDIKQVEIQQNRIITEKAVMEVTHADSIEREDGFVSSAYNCLHPSVIIKMRFHQSLKYSIRKK